MVSPDAELNWYGITGFGQNILTLKTSTPQKPIFSLFPPAKCNIFVTFERDGNVTIFRARNFKREYLPNGIFKKHTFQLRLMRRI